MSPPATIKVRTGQRFGRWKVTNPETRMATPSGRSVRAAEVRCDCGTVKLVTLPDLAAGRTTSCRSCAASARVAKIRKGRRFGRLRVTRVIPGSGRGRRRAECVCDCGASTTVMTQSLLSGGTKSCGCLHRLPPRAAIRASSAASVARSAGVSGQRFGRLRVTRVIPPASSGERCSRAECVCDCGGSVTVRADLLRSGTARSCGCLAREASAVRIAAQMTTHGLARHPLYQTWRGMIARCEDPRTRAYACYGGRGIRVCPQWHDVAVFIAEIEREIGPRPEGRFPSGQPLYSIDRKDNDGDYEPGNVRWATASQQRANQRLMLGTDREFADAPDTDMECPTCGEPMPSLSAFDRHRVREHQAS